MSIKMFFAIFEILIINVPALAKPSNEGNLNGQIHK